MERFQNNLTYDHGNNIKVEENNSPHNYHTDGSRNAQPSDLSQIAKGQFQNVRSSLATGVYDMERIRQSVNGQTGPYDRFNNYAHGLQSAQR